MGNITLTEIGAVVALVVGIVKGIEYFANPIAKQVKRLETLEKDMELSKTDREGIKEFMKVNFVVLKELLNHNIDGGNNIDGLKRANKEIDGYLSKKI